jgi:hypothetical protein
MGERKANMIGLCVMDEGRKRVRLIPAAILAARKLCQLESTCPSLALLNHRGCRFPKRQEPFLRP